MTRKYIKHLDHGNCTQCGGLFSLDKKHRRYVCLDCKNTVSAVSRAEHPAYETMAGIKLLRERLV